VQADLDRRVATLEAVQGSLLQARDRLVELENRLHLATAALAANLVASCEGGQPNLVTVILSSHSCGQLLEQVLHGPGRESGLARGRPDARHSRCRRSPGRTLASLEARDCALADQVLARRNEVAALEAALLHKQRFVVRHPAGL
jgi:hypothetical protein